MKEYRGYIIIIACSLLAGVFPSFLNSISEPETISNAKNPLIYWYLVIIFIVIVVLLLIAFFGNHLYSSFKSKKENYTRFIYERYKQTIEYLDDNGKNVSMTNSIYIGKLSLRWGENTTTEILTHGFGKVIPEIGNGINVKLEIEEDDALSYSTNFSKKNVLNKTHYTSFSVRFIDTFNQPSAKYWDFGPKHHCKYFEFILIYPNINKDIKLTFKKGNKCENGSCENWINDSETTYTSYTRFGKKVAKVLFYNVRNTEARLIKWDFV